MVSGTLHAEAVNYPAVEAQNNMPFEYTIQDLLKFKVPVVTTVITGSRATTSDPWEIQLVDYEYDGSATYSGGEYEIKSDDMNWKSMADLTVKMHQRAIAGQTWKAIEVKGFPLGFPKVNVMQFANVDVDELNQIAEVHLDDCGNYSLHLDAGATGAQYMGNSGTALRWAFVARGLAAILANTTDTSASEQTPAMFRNFDEVEAELETKISFKKASGTDAVTIGNFTSSKHLIRIKAAPAGGYGVLHSVRTLDKQTAFSIPSIQLDHIRRAAKANLTPTVELIAMPGDGLAAEADWAAARVGGVLVQGDVAFVSALSPDSVLEFGLDQANTMNILAAAAFAGLAGLTSVGVAVELQKMLENSVLAPLFQNVAVSLGATTAGVITGYVSALVAAYTNGWITNSQLFDMQQHIAWIQAGYQTLALAATTGAAISGIGGLLGYLGVSSNVVSTAIVAAGGATAGAGIALGMASVMGKVVRHRYLGE